MAQSPGAFMVTGSTTTPRSTHTATLLPDGRVLIAGGAYPFYATNTAELYDPATGTFAVTGSMTNARSGHVATLLPAGRVLITGGYPGADAEIYDPSIGRFTLAGSMTTWRQWHTATLLNDGRVLLAGGGYSVGPSVVGDATSAELYDPSTGVFAATGKMTAARRSHKATLLADGNVLIAPGSDGADYETAEIYNADAGTFSALAFANSRGYVAATANALPNGKVLFTLQVAECDIPSRFANAYDSAAATFTAAADMTYPHCQQTSAPLPDGSVLIVGSLLDSFGPVPGAEVYDAVSGTFSGTGVMTVGRQFPTATLLNDGRVLVVGGPVANAELYTPTALVPAPALFSLSGDGRGQGAIWKAATGEIAAPGSAAVAGEALAMYTTSLAAGGAIPPQVAVGGRLAKVVYFGAAPGYPGYNQVNFLMPSGVTPGSTVPVRVSYLSRWSNEVTMGAR